MGEVELPRDTILHPVFIDGETIVTAIEDETGTIMVKRYRLVLSGGGLPPPGGQEEG